MSWLTIVVLAVTLLAASGVVYQLAGAARNRFTPPGTLVEVGSRRLHYRCAGRGTPAVIFEAGLAASSLSWSNVQPEVAKFTQACSYDRAGLAWSDAGERVRSMAGFVAELRRLLERAGIPPPYILVGHSFGGIIIRAFARAYRSEVAGLVFVDTLHAQEWMNLTFDQRRTLRGGVLLSNIGAVLARFGIVRLCLSLLSRGAVGLPRRFSRLFGPTAAALLEHMVGEVQKLPVEVLPMVQAHWSQPRAFQAMAQHLAALPMCCEELARSADILENLPIVVLSAANRSPRWLAADAELARMSTAGQHRVSTRAGHWIQLDDPSLVVDAVRDIVGRSRERDRINQ